MNINYMKAGIAALTLICMTVLMALSVVTSAAGIPIITMIVGYAIGNGIAARSDTPVEPLFGRKPGPQDRAEFDAYVAGKQAHEDA